MKKRIHVNQHNIKANVKDGGKRPVVSVRTSKGTKWGHQVEIQGPSKVIHSPDDPLGCGARVWVETDAPITVDGEEFENGK